MANQRTLVRVQRTVDNVVYYGWGIFPAAGGDPTSEAWTTDPDANPGGYTAWYMNESAYGTTKSAGKGRWAECFTCRYEFPISELTLIKGKFYCSKNKCDTDFVPFVNGGA